MSKTKDNATPSMEDILQTIRGVIAGESVEEDVLELTEMVAEDGSVTSLKPSANENRQQSVGKDILADIDNALQEEEKTDDKFISEDEEPAAWEKAAEEPFKEKVKTTPDLLQTEASFKIEEPQEQPVPAKRSSQLISPETASASTKALKNLLYRVPKPHVDGPAFRTGVTLEELVIEAMKPELSAWLDKNLATLVTHLVEKEIQKLLPKAEE